MNFEFRNMMNKLRYIVTAALLIGSVAVFAQQNESVVVEGTYRPEIEKVRKMGIVPDENPHSFAVPDQQVEVKDINHKFPIDLETMSPVGYSNKDGKGRSDDVAQNFLLAAFGTRLSPLFVYRHNSDLSKTIGLGVGVSHYSSWLKMKNYPNSSFMNNRFDIALTANLDSYRLSNKVYYNNDMNHYYGCPLDSITPEDLVDTLCSKQIYNTIGFESRISSTTTRLGYMRHAFGLNYQYTFSRTGAREHYLNFETDLAYVNNFWGKKENPQTIGVKISLMYDRYGVKKNAPYASSYIDYGADPDMTNRVLFGFKPYFEIKADFCKIDLGVSLDVAHDTATKVAVRPDINACLYLFNKKAEIYAVLDGGLKAHTFSGLAEQNPFVASMLPMRFANTKFGFGAGVRTSIKKKVDLHAGVRYRRIQDEAFFVRSVSPLLPLNDSTPVNPLYYNEFSLLYDTVNELNIMADLRWRILDNLTLEGSFAYNYIGNGDKEWHPWYRPAVEATVKVGYSPIKQLDFGLSAMLGFGRYAKVWDGELWQVEKLKPIVDLNFSANYNINERVTVFVNLDNLTHTRYQLYYNYPVTGIQAFAGLKVKF